MWMSDRKAELSDYTLAQGPPLLCFSFKQNTPRGEGRGGREGGGSPRSAAQSTFRTRPGSSGQAKAEAVKKPSPSLPAAPRLKVSPDRLRLSRLQPTPGSWQKQQVRRGGLLLLLLLLAGRLGWGCRWGASPRSREVA